MIRRCLESAPVVWVNQDNSRLEITWGLLSLLCCLMFYYPNTDQISKLLLSSQLLHLVGSRSYSGDQSIPVR